ncbi:MAG: glycosyltransferase family 2 protein [Puniceicoccales bacterium]|jgi:glycosyltransferase involved in cell wall biosynthesis|nr:glycosyltransferase family 2 protein [Puniceicoccales bacterium]
MNLSYVVPVYNVRPYLAECLDSILKQKYVFEIICINDDSTDGSELLLEEYKNKHDKIKIIHQKNKGLAAARNRGLRESSGDYVAFVDSDDRLSLNHSEITEKIVRERHPDMIVLHATVLDEIQGTRYPFYDNVFLRKITREKLDTKIQGESDFLYFLLEPNTVRRVYSKNFADRISLNFPEGLIYEDTPIHFEVGLASRNIVVSQRLGFYYRVANRNSITQDNGRRRLDIISIFKQTLEILEKYKARDFVYTAYVHTIVRMGWWCHSSASDITVKYQIKSELSKILRSIDAKHFDAYLNSGLFSWDEKKKFFAIWHLIPSRIAKKIPFPLLKSKIAKPLLLLISAFNK